MAIELVTGKAGTPHVSSDDIGAYQAGISGYGVLRLANKNGHHPEASLLDANRVTIPAMGLLIDGRYVRISAAETVTLTSGSAGTKRIDLVCVTYSRNSTTGVENVSLSVVKGSPTSGTPSTPSVSGRIIDGATYARYPIASITLDGITPAQPVMLGAKLYPQEAETYTPTNTPSGGYRATDALLMRSGRNVSLSFTLRGDGSRIGDWGTISLLKIPEDVRPLRDISVSAVGYSADTASKSITVTTTGEVRYGGSQYASSGVNGGVNIHLSWII